MNCEKCQNLISEFVDGSLGSEDYEQVRAHAGACRDCAAVLSDLSAIVSFCREHREEYDAPPNERALWLRIRASVVSELPAGRAVAAAAAGARRGRWWSGLMSRSWEFSFPQLASAVVGIVLVVSLGSSLGIRLLRNPAPSTPDLRTTSQAFTTSSLPDRIRRQQQVIDYWNQRVELNKARWSPQMRETFNRNMSVIDQALSDSLRVLDNNPHDEVSEEMLNAALNDKVELLREFADL
jgi:hypothetical protein